MPFCVALMQLFVFCMWISLIVLIHSYIDNEKQMAETDSSVTHHVCPSVHDGMKKKLTKSLLFVPDRQYKWEIYKVWAPVIVKKWGLVSLGIKYKLCNQSK
jgi:hypothetical protein